jgi:hypothetical protein
MFNLDPFFPAVQNPERNPGLHREKNPFLCTGAGPDRSGRGAGNHGSDFSNQGFVDPAPIAFEILKKDPRAASADDLDRKKFFRLPQNVIAGPGSAPDVGNRRCYGQPFRSGLGSAGTPTQKHRQDHEERPSKAGSLPFTRAQTCVGGHQDDESLPPGPHPKRRHIPPGAMRCRGPLFPRPCRRVGTVPLH